MKKDVVFITSVTLPGKESRSEPYSIGIKSWKHWCKKHDVELIVCEDLLFPENELAINFHRYYAFDILDYNNIDYDQVLISDADCIIHPDVPNFFKMTDHKYTVTRSVGDVDWMIRGIENYSKFLFDNKIFDFCDRYFNAGFQIVNSTHRHLWEKMMKFYFDNKNQIIHLQNEYGNGKDQVLINMIVNLNLSKQDMTYLPYEFCASHLHRLEILQDELFLKCFPGIYQFNGMPDDIRTIYMNNAYNKLYHD